MNTKEKTTKQRLLSLDTLRGFDMLWIVGGDLFFHSLASHTDWAWAAVMSKHMHHKWNGFHFYDLIFPLFMFISGVAIPYALLSKLEKGVSKKKLYYKTLKRALTLLLFGAIYNGALQLDFGSLRIASVLGQIGIAYLIAAIIAINFRSLKGVVLWIVGILITYGIVQLFIPVPGHGAGFFNHQQGWNGYIDRLLLPGKLLGKYGDPEGILCIISASAITLMGVIAGYILRSEKYHAHKKAGIMFTLGTLLVMLAVVLKPWYPIIKSLWTSTFNLLTGGLSFILMAVFYLVIDVWKYQKWTFFFRVIGLNSITIYLANKMIDFKATSTFLFGGIARVFGGFSPDIIIIGIILLEWYLLYFLYKKNIFLKV